MKSMPVNRRQDCRPVFALDEQGNSVVYVPLSDGTQAIVDASALRRLTSIGLTSRWTINSDGDNRLYVRCRYKGRMTIVARLITAAAPNTLIRYKNGDHRDLRRSNLKVTLKKASLYAV